MKKIIISIIILFITINIFAQNIIDADYYVLGRNNFEKYFSGIVYEKALQRFSDDRNFWKEFYDKTEMLETDEEKAYVLLETALVLLTSSENVTENEDAFLYFMKKVFDNIRPFEETNIIDIYYKTFIILLDQIDADEHPKNLIRQDYMRLIGKNPNDYLLEDHSALDIYTFEFDDTITYEEAYDFIKKLELLLSEDWDNLWTYYSNRIELANQLIDNLYKNSFKEEELIEFVLDKKNKVEKQKDFSRDEIINSEFTFNENLNLQNNFSESIKLLIKSADKYENLKNNEEYKTLKDKLEGTENRIDLARMKYNTSAIKYNSTIRHYNSLSNLKNLQIKRYF